MLLNSGAALPRLTPRASRIWIWLGTKLKHTPGTSVDLQHPKSKIIALLNTAGTMPGLSVKLARCHPGDRMSPMSTSSSLQTSALHAAAPRKGGHDAQAFRETSSALPV